MKNKSPVWSIVCNTMVKHDLPWQINGVPFIQLPSCGAFVWNIAIASPTTKKYGDLQDIPFVMVNHLITTVKHGLSCLPLCMMVFLSACVFLNLPQPLRKHVHKDHNVLWYLLIYNYDNFFLILFLACFFIIWTVLE